MPETNPEKQELQPGLTPEQKLLLTGLVAAVRTDAWTFWAEAMPDGPEVVEARVSRIDYDLDGNPVAFGVKRSEMLRHIELHGDLNHNSARGIAIDPDRDVLFTASGTQMWPLLDLPAEFFNSKAREE